MASVGLATGATLLSWGLFAGGLALTTKNEGAGIAVLSVGLAGSVVGPSAGHFYVGENGRGLLTSGIRLALLGAATGLFGAGASQDFLEDDSGRSDRYFIPATAALLGSVALSIYDIVDAGFAPRRAQRSSTAVAPMVLGDREGITGGGASLSMTF